MRTNRRALILPEPNGWTDEENLKYDWIVSAFYSTVSKATKFKQVKPHGKVSFSEDPMLVFYNLQGSDPWNEDSWIYLLANRSNPLSIRALFLLYVKENEKRGVKWLWRSDNGDIIAPVNPNTALVRWLPKGDTNNVWECPVGVWEDSAGLTAMETFAMCVQKCWTNPNYRSVIDSVYFDMPGWCWPFSTWPSRDRGMQQWPGRIYNCSPIMNTTRNFLQILKQTIPDFKYMTNSYGNHPSWGNRGMFAIDPIGHKFEMMLDQNGSHRDNGNPNIWKWYWNNDHNHDTDQYGHTESADWPNWKMGYKYCQDIGMDTSNIAIQCAPRSGWDNERIRRHYRWCVGTALLLDGFVGINRSWSDYSVPGIFECPEFWTWTEDIVPDPHAPTFIEKDLTKYPGQEGKIYYRRYVGGTNDRKKYIIVVNPSIDKEVATIPPKDALMISLNNLSFSDLIKWNQVLEGI